MTEQTNEELLNRFKNLFGSAGQYGSFNDLRRNSANLSETSPPEKGQLRNEAGTGGINLVDRIGRQRLSDPDFIRQNGGSQRIAGFFDTEGSDPINSLF